MLLGDIFNKLIYKRKKLKKFKRKNRSFCGHIICHSKGRSYIKNFKTIDSYLYYMNTVYFVCCIKISYIFFKQCVLVFAAPGFYNILPNNSKYILFNFWFGFFSFKNFFFFLPFVFSYLCHFKNGGLISFLEIKKRTRLQYGRSCNSFCKIMLLNYYSGFVFIMLPSKKRVYISVFCRAFSGRNVNLEKINKLASINIKLGFKPTVRGVAKNAIDHPHGGKTKSIKLAKTPWGFLTKR